MSREDFMKMKKIASQKQESRKENKVYEIGAHLVMTAMNRKGDKKCVEIVEKKKNKMENQ